MSYQSGGYQYSNVPPAEDPLSNPNPNSQPHHNPHNAVNSNGSIAVPSANVDPSMMAPPTPPAPLPSQEQQQQVQQYASSSTIPASSPYSPRAYMTSYHEYVQSTSNAAGGNFNSTAANAAGFGNGNPNPNYNNAFGNEFMYSHSNSPFQYLESQRKSRRNKMMMGLAAIVFIFLLLDPASRTYPSDKVSVTTEGTEGNVVDIDPNESVNEQGAEQSAEQNAELNEEQNTHASADEEVSEEDIINGNIDNYTPNHNPMLTYLLTYPMSGTSYSMELIEKTTNMAIATNFEKIESYKGPKSKDGMRSVAEDYADLMKTNHTCDYGYPLWTKSYENSELPTDQVVTLAHCSGYCLSPCTPDEYIHSESSFEESCRQVTYFNTTSHEYESYLLPTDAVDSVIHLIRDPMSNIVSRFHQFEIIDIEEHDSRWGKKHGKNEKSANEKFRSWCHEMDQNKTMTDIEQSVEHMFSAEMKRSMKEIPCHSEFVKYVSWHNHVVEMIWSKGYRSLQVYFEDYGHEDTREEVANKMAEFLGYKIEKDLSKLPEFGVRQYRNLYYTEEEIEALAKFFETVSYKETWKLLSRYF